MNRDWTPEELDVIRADTAARVSRVVTAAKLNRPVAATRTRALMIGCSFQPHRGWDEAEVALLRSLFDRGGALPTDSEIEAATGRKPTSFRPKLKELGLVGQRRHRGDVAASAETVARRRAGVEARPRGTKIRDERRAIAERKALRLLRRQEARAAVDARIAARAEARRVAAAAREQAREEAERQAFALRESRKAAKAQADAMLRPVRPVKPVAVRRPKAVRARPPAARVAPSIVGRQAAEVRPGPVVDRRAVMREALDRVAARRLVAVPERAASAEERLMALLGAR